MKFWLCHLIDCDAFERMELVLVLAPSLSLLLDEALLKPNLKKSNWHIPSPNDELFFLRVNTKLWSSLNPLVVTQAWSVSHYLTEMNDKQLPIELNSHQSNLIHCLSGIEEVFWEVSVLMKEA